ncbi:substrate-binding domain-containing protein [Seohaeicola zhoushanensis]
MITDQPHSERDHFVGIDNLAAGRTAGVLMGRFVGPRAGKIVVAVNSMQARDMVDRRMGFDEVLAERFPGLVALPTIEGRDNHEVVARVTAQCLDNHDGVVGIYCAGAGLRGITEVVRARAGGEVGHHRPRPHPAFARDAHLGGGRRHHQSERRAYRPQRGAGAQGAMRWSGGHRQPGAHPHRDRIEGKSA